MMWLDRLINNKIDYRLSSLSDQIKILFEQFEDEIVIFKRLQADVSEIKKLIINIQEEQSISNRRLNLKIDERESELRSDLELSITGMTKVIDRRLESLGEKKGIVVDLLKKIAKLEGDNVS